MTRVLIVGGSGLVGWMLVNEFVEAGHEVGFSSYQTSVRHEAATHYTLDLTDEAACRALFGDFEPEVTIHAAGLTDADECERNPDRARSVNVDGTERIVAACQRHSSRLIYFSSSFVFGSGGPYDEHDERAPINVYGETKVAAEDLVDQADVETAILRIDQPYGWSRPWQADTMVTWLLQALADHEVVPVFRDWYNNPILLADVGSSVSAVIDRDVTGLYHVVGDEFINRYEWAKILLDVFDIDARRIRPISSESASSMAQRPTAELGNRRMKTELGVRPHGVRSGAEHLLESRDGSELLAAARV